MGTGRMEAFSDGVIAILITIMVLDLRAPAGPHLRDLRALVPLFLCYVLSFVNLAIYWVNHHHLLQVTERVSGGILWANLHLLFWLSLFPFATAWMGEHHFSPVPVAVYGVVALLSAMAYYLLQTVIVQVHGRSSALAEALGRDLKGKLSLVVYLVSIPLALVDRWLALGGYVLVALVWLIPDRRLEPLAGVVRSPEDPAA